MTTIEIKKYSIGAFVIAFCVIIGPKNVYLDTKIFFLNQLETEKLKHVYSGAILEKIDCHNGQIINLRIYNNGLLCNPWSR